MNQTNLHNYQLTTVEHIRENTHCGIFLDMGLGKTVSTLTAFNSLAYEDLEVSRALVIAPKRVAESVWSAEVDKWDHLRHLKVVKIIGSEKQRRKALAERADVYTIGRDNVAWLCGLYGGSMLPFDVLIIDELSGFKNPSSVRFKALRAVQPSFKRVIGLTGTPAPNGLIDLWSQIYLLDRGQRLGKFISHYREDYFHPTKKNGPITYKYGLNKDAEERIYSKIGDICISMKAKDYLELPGRVDNVIRLTLPPDVRKKYDDFERDQVLKLVQMEGDREISAVNAAAMFNKLLQFSNGAVYDEAKNFHVIHDLKIEALKEIIEDANGKSVLVAWTFRHDMERLMVALKKYGPKELKTDEDINDWNDGKIPVMLMHPASGGHGLNLQKGGNIIVWFGQTPSLELEQQFNARLDRQGQKEVVIINKIVIANTIDEEMIELINNKANGQDRLLNAVKARVKKYYSHFE